MKYTSDPIPQARQELSRLIKEAGDVIDIAHASELLKLDRIATAKKLARWTEQGWLRRVAKGVYVAASLDMLENDTVVSDPWVLVPALFEPAYIGGRTASEHWDMTEQIFNDIVVMTARTVRHKTQVHQGITFSLKHIAPTKVFGTKVLWRENTKVAVSDPHRTIIDMLDDPMIGGGIQHVADCLSVYLNRSDRSDERLIEYADRLGNGAVFKRLGFLLEREGKNRALQAKCAERLTKGNARLDPVMSQGKIVSRWRLVVPHNLLQGEGT
ncbi:hypothetical protein L2D01_05990 [Hyphomonadaceae bacterium ML37]|nr:hypothetical protein L2D01_05990 [Hyphomonadaceae bacterium ML37]